MSWDMKTRLMRIMVVLRNIKRDDLKKTIEADYYPDDGNLFGHVVVDITSEQIISFTEILGITWRFALAHARKGLVDLSDKKEIPNKKTICWY